MTLGIVVFFRLTLWRVIAFVSTLIFARVLLPAAPGEAGFFDLLPEDFDDGPLEEGFGPRPLESLFNILGCRQLSDFRKPEHIQTASQKGSGFNLKLERHRTAHLQAENL